MNRRSPTLRCLGLIAALPLASLASAQISLRLTEVRALGSTLDSPPALGDSGYRLRASWTVTGTPRPYRVRFQMANRSTYIKETGGTGTYGAFATWKMPLDGKIPIAVTLDPDGVNENDAPDHAQYTGSFEPSLPSKAVQYYDPKNVKAAQSMETTTSAMLLRHEVFFGVPVSETSQVVTSYQPPPASGNFTVGPFNQLLCLKERDGLDAGTSSVGQSFEATVSNCCINPSKMTDSWTDLSQVPAGIQPYTKPEVEIESEDPAIVAFADQNLPPTYRTTLAPIETARLLFQAVQRTLTYNTVEAPDAVGVLNDQKGDCAGMSKVYLACLRHVGIPCRLVCGWLMGQDKWHCWTEMYLPSAGWIPQDVQEGQASDPTGTYPYFFSCMSDLNRRVRVTAATTYIVPEMVYTDGPQKGFTHLSWLGEKPSVSTVNHCTLALQ